MAQSGAVTCALATSLTINVDCGYNNPMAASVSAGSTPSVCGVAVQGDNWFMFTTLNTTAATTITADCTSPSPRDIAIQLLSACPSTTINCVNATGPGALTEILVANLAPLTTYYIRIVNLHASTLYYQNVCVTQPPEDDEPLGATEITVESGACNPIIFDNTVYTSSTCAPAPTCGNFVTGSSNDVWCKLIVPASGNFFLQTEGTYFGPPYDNFAMAVYSSSVCGSATILGCSDGNPHGIIDPITLLPYDYAPMSMPSLYISGATPSSTVYVRVWNEGGSLPGGFAICANDMGPCGNAANNDFCSNPASVNFGGVTPGSSATNTVTGIAYTDDYPGDTYALTLNGSCFIPFQNSWYSFIATSADAGGLTIPFIADAGCQVEATIFDISRTSNGCCKNFVELSGCNGSSFISNPFNVTVPAGVLVPGNTYNLMINNGDPSTCSFTITGWSATGVLPVELVSFTGENEGKYNVLEWVTASEKNVESYTLEHSADASNFVPITTIAAKNTQQNATYAANDENPFEDVTYYRIKQTDKDGKEKYTNTISVSLRNLYDNIFNIHPNPTTSNLNFEYYSKSTGALDIELINYAGASVLKLNQRLEEGKNNITLPMSQLQNGVYILKVVSVQSGKTTYHKIIKN